MRRPLPRLNRGRVPAKGGIFVPPPFAITNPADLANVVSGVPIAVSGTSPAVAPVNVTGNAIAIGSSPVVGNAWSVPWTPGAAGPVALAATDGALSANISVTVVSAVAFAFTNPADLASLPTGTPVTVSGTSPSSAPVSVTANGIPIGSSPVAGGVWSFSWTPTVVAATTLAATDGTLNAVISVTVTAAGPRHPTAIIPWIAFYDLGLSVVTETGANVTGITDLSGNGRHSVVAGTVTKIAADATLGAGTQTTVQVVSGAAIASVGGYDPAPPGTTPLFVFGIVRVEEWVISRCLFGAASSTLVLVAAGVTPQWALRNSTQSDLMGIPINSWGRLRAKFSNAVGDTFRFRATQSAGAINPGNADPGAISWMSRASSVTATAAKWLAWGITSTIPSAAEMTEMDDYYELRTGAVLT